MYINIVLASFVIMLASLIGVVFVWKGFGRFLEKNKKYLTTFAIGVFVVVAYSLSIETFHLTDNYVLAIASIIGGVVFFRIATFFLPHHHHDTEGCCPENHTRINARRVLLSDAIHNTVDGLLLFSAFTLDERLGIAAAIGILLHELVQEIAEFFILKEAGYSTKKALMYNFLVSSTILIGILIGVFISNISLANILLIGLAAGGFIYILIADLFPHTCKVAKTSKEKIIHVSVGVVGILLMLLTFSTTADSHDHSHDHSAEEIFHDEHEENKTIEDHHENDDYHNDEDGVDDDHHEVGDLHDEYKDLHE